MVRRMKHRGPDDEGFVLFKAGTNEFKSYYGDDTPREVLEENLLYTPKEKYHYREDYSIALGHRRLSIIDLSAKAHQPLCDESGRYWIVFNGEIYNFHELRERLIRIGYSFGSNSDTEVVLKSYMAWKDDCQSHFNGMWAAVIWDNLEKKIWISRDRFGIKPLNLVIQNGFFAVCSEIKSVIDITALKPNKKEIFAYLLQGPNEAIAETFFENVYRFPAGHSAVYRLNDNHRELVFKKYWELEEPDCFGAFSRKKALNYAEEYYSLLKDAVKIRMKSDVQFSCALSGGLDSSVITFLASENLKSDRNSGSSLITVSNVYDDKNLKEYDESEFIDLMVNTHHIKNLRSSPENTAVLKMNDIGLWCYENCYDDFPVSAMNTFKLCKENNIKVNLDGQGADEIHAGYTRYWLNYFSAKYFFEADYLLSIVLSPLKLTEKIRAMLKIGYFGTAARPVSELLRNKLDKDYLILRNRYDQSDKIDIDLNQALTLSIKYNLKKLLRNVDCYSMAYSVESRQPYMDYRIIKMMQSIPASFKMRKGWSKYLSRFAFSNKLPDRIVWRKDKLGWPQPTRYWLENFVGKEIVNDINSSRFLRELLDPFNGLDLKKVKSDKSILRFYHLARHFEIFYKKKYPLEAP